MRRAGADVALFKCRKVLSSLPEPRGPNSGCLQLYSKLPQTSGLKTAIYRYYVSGFWCRVGKAQQGLTSLGPRLGRLRWLGADRASRPRSVCIVLHVDGLGFPPAWRPQGSHPLSTVARVSVSRDEEAGSRPMGEAWSWQSSSSRPAQIQAATWTFTLNGKSVK